MKTRNLLGIALAVVITQGAIAQSAPIADLVQAYYGITEALIVDDGSATKVKAEDFLRMAEAIGSGPEAPHPAWQRWYPRLKSAGEAIAKTTSVEKQRAHLNDLSVALAALVKELPGPGRPVYYQFCPMKQSYWLSPQKDIRNPYYGKKMLTCGKTMDTIQ